MQLPVGRARVDFTGWLVAHGVFIELCRVLGLVAVLLISAAHRPTDRPTDYSRHRSAVLVLFAVETRSRTVRPGFSHDTALKPPPSKKNDLCFILVIIDHIGGCNLLWITLPECAD